MTYGAALSEHPDTAVAVGEVVGQVLDTMKGARPDLALVFVSRAHVRSLADVASTIRAAVAPGALLGCAAESVVGPGREVEDEPAVALWAGQTGEVVPFHLSLTSTPDGDALVGWPENLPGQAGTLMLIADPFTFPTEPFLGRLDEDRPGLAVVGGMASAGRAPGETRLVLDDRVLNHGAVGVFLGPDVEVVPVVSQGCRPIGDPFVVTRAEHNVIYELGGRPALERLKDLARASSPEDRELMSLGLHVGRVIDEHRADFGRGDFLIRNVMGADEASGAIAIGDVVDVGATTQFQVRDAASADDDLRQLLQDRRADAALLFTCNGRGTRLFGTPDHDAGVLLDYLPRAAVAGMSCQGELGPVGGKNFLHGFTASMVLLSSPR